MSGFEETVYSNGRRDTLFFHKDEELVGTIRRLLPDTKVYTMNCPAIHCPDTKFEVLARSIKATRTVGEPDDDPDSHIEDLVAEFVEYLQTCQYKRVYLYTLGVMTSYPAIEDEDGNFVADKENGRMGFTARFGYLNE